MLSFRPPTVSLLSMATKKKQILCRCHSVCWMMRKQTGLFQAPLDRSRGLYHATKVTVYPQLPREPNNILKTLMGPVTYSKSKCREFVCLAGWSQFAQNPIPKSKAEPGSSQFLSGNGEYFNILHIPLKP